MEEQTQGTLTLRQEAEAQLREEFAKAQRKEMMDKLIEINRARLKQVELDKTISNLELDAKKLEERTYEEWLGTKNQPGFFRLPVDFGGFTTSYTSTN